MSKLVRDKIPEIINNNGEFCTYHIASDAEYFDRLKSKLLEEAHEFTIDENEEELADILEVIKAICDYKNFNLDNIEKIANSKKETKGSFTKRIILE